MKKYQHYKKAGIAAVLVLALAITGCKKFVEIDKPIDSIPTDVVFDNDIKADAAVRALYLGMVQSVNTGFSGGFQCGLGASADELAVTAATNQFNDFYINSVSSSTSANANNWNLLYSVIYNANQIINNIPLSTGMTAANKTRYMAEARFMRAAMYFYLINIYGDVPKVTSNDYQTNTNIARSPVNDIYDLITADLLYAQSNLPAAYLSSTQRARANRYAASALLARVYLYRQKWTDAEAAATDVITGGSSLYAMENDLSKTFLLTSKEAILQLPPIATNAYVYEGFVFIPTTGAPNYTITDALYNSFETGDLRKTNWIKTYTVVTAGVSKTYNGLFKYKLNSGTGTKTEGWIFLRASETYLIRAEARARQGNLSAAIADLDVVRGRSGIAKIAVTNPGISQTNLLSTIMHERFVELFEECGHRWFDLKRTGQADDVLKNKPNWRPEAKLMPIPANEIKYNPSMVQNPGYN